MPDTPQPTSIESVPVDDGAVTVARWGDGTAGIILLHDGLGSIRQWRSIPAEVAAKTGKTVLAYDRPGHGDSTPVPTGPWPADWLHREAARFGRLLPKLDLVPEPLVVGHSDGGSIALLHAAAGGRMRGLLTLAAHSWVEQTCFDGIVGMRANTDSIVRGLGRDHPHPDAVFEAWSGVWVSDEFRTWDIRPMLATVSCPTVVAQGVDDEYAASAHAVDTAAAIGENAEYLLLDGVGHLLHHQDPDLVVRLIAQMDDRWSP
ncbi:MAG: alpha/beta hydrolase [Actinomycetota bacterium]